MRSAFFLLLLAACAPQPQPESAAPAVESLLPGSIGLLAARQAKGLVVTALKKDGAAAAAGVRAGDVVLRYNGAPVSNVREFNRLVLESRPGTTARVDLSRDGDLHRVEVPVRELDTMPRV